MIPPDIAPWACFVVVMCVSCFFLGFWLGVQHERRADQ